jgi:hypothetical protein
VWPVVSGLVMTMRSAGFAFNEVVVSMLDHPDAVPSLRRFARLIAIVTTAVLLAVAVTPLGGLWFSRVSALHADLMPLALVGVWLGAPLPALTAYFSWFQGALVHSRKTRAVTESMAIYLGTIVVLLGVGVRLNAITGIYVALAAMTLGVAAQVAWLWWRARGTIRRLETV